MHAKAIEKEKLKTILPFFQTSVVSYDSHGYPLKVAPTGLSSASSGLQASFDDVVEVLVAEACGSGCPKCSERQQHQLTVTTPAGEIISFSFEAGIAGWVLATLFGLSWAILFGLVKAGKIEMKLGKAGNNNANLPAAREAFLDRVQAQGGDVCPPSFRTASSSLYAAPTFYSAASSTVTDSSIYSEVY